MIVIYLEKQYEKILNRYNLTQLLQLKDKEIINVNQSKHFIIKLIKKYRYQTILNI